MGACMAREIPVQLSTDTHDFEKYSRGATKHTRVTRMRVCMATSHVRVWHAKFSCSCLQTRTILKNTREELRNTRVSPARVLQV